MTVSISDDEVEAACEAQALLHGSGWGSLPAKTKAHKRQDMREILSAAAKVRAIRDGDGEWVRTAVQQYLAQMKAAHADTETGPGYINSGSYFSTLDNLPDFVAAASPAATGGEKE